MVSHVRYAAKSGIQIQSVVALNEFAGDSGLVRNMEQVLARVREGADSRIVNGNCAGHCVAPRTARAQASTLIELG